MKKTTLVILTCILGICSCKKDNHNNNNGGTGTAKTYPITFSLAPLSTSTKATNSLTVSSLDTALTNHVKTIAYVLFDTHGNQIDQIRQDTTFANFGTINDRVPAGTYYAYFMANSVYNYFGGNPFFYANNPSSGTNDVFYRKDTVVVGNSTVNQNIVMGRTTAMLVLDIQDAVPQGVTSIQINPGGGYAYNVIDTSYYSYGATPAVTHNFTTSEIGATDVKVSMIIYYPDILHNITLTVFEADGQLGNPIVINNVKFICNHITTLTGTVFNKTGDNDNNFQISISTGWNTSTIGF